MKENKIVTTSKIIKKDGIPSLYINGKEIPGDAYITYIENNNQYKEFSNCGFRLFSCSVAFNKRSINEWTKLEPFLKSMEGDFTKFDESINLILNANPNAYIIPRINIELDEEWEENHPLELNDNGLNGGKRRICLSSDLWLSTVKKNLISLLKHVEGQEYVNSIAGYQIAGAMTEEWMTFDFNGSEGKRSREKFIELVNEGLYKNTDEEYHKYLNDRVAYVISELAKTVKEETNHRLIVGSFYGYTFNQPSWKFGHSSVNKLLECNDIDFLCSPVAYFTSREAGVVHPYMVAIDSLKLHGKLYFSENDTRTDLSKANFTNPNYNTPIWFGPNRELSLEIIKYHYGRALCHSHAYWWFDMWGKWYDADDYRKLFAKQIDISKESISENRTSRKQIAVLIDETSYYHVKDDITIERKITVDSLIPLGQCGYSFDYYLASDFSYIKDQYKCFVLFKINDSYFNKQIQDYCESNNIPCLIIDKENYLMNEIDYRTYFKSIGIDPWFNTDVVIDENETYLSVYTVKDTILEQPKSKLVSLYEDVSWPIKAKKGYNYLFKKIK